MADLATQSIVGTGLAPAYAAAAAGGDTVAPGDKTFIHVKNTGAGALTVTVAGVGVCDRGAAHDLVVSVPATMGDRMIGPVTASRFGRASDGRAAVTYSGVTGLTVASIAVS